MAVGVNYDDDVAVGVRFDVDDWDSHHACGLVALRAPHDACALRLACVRRSGRLIFWAPHLLRHGRLIFYAMGASSSTPCLWASPCLCASLWPPHLLAVAVDVRGAKIGGVDVRSAVMFVVLRLWVLTLVAL